MASILATTSILSLLGTFFTVLSTGQASGPGLLPDLRTVVPLHLQLVNEHQQEILRFSNGVANTGEGPWRMRAKFPLADPSEPQEAIQEILDVEGNVVQEAPVSQFEYHPAHRHWHIHAVAAFSIHHDAPDGPIVGNALLKTTFCLIDWYKLGDNSPTTERTYFDCFGTYQGISPGWVDQYHMSTEGQEFDITGLPVGHYYLVSTANPDGVFIESNTSNNTAWIGFDLTRESKGNPKITIVEYSPCESAGLCGDRAPNR